MFPCTGLFFCYWEMAAPFRNPWRTVRASLVNTKIVYFRAASGGSSGIDSQLSEFDIFLVDFSVRPRFLEILRARTECGRRTWFSTATTLTRCVFPFRADARWLSQSRTISMSQSQRDCDRCHNLKIVKPCHNLNWDCDLRLWWLRLLWVWSWFPNGNRAPTERVGSKHIRFD